MHGSIIQLSNSYCCPLQVSTKDKFGNSLNIGGNHFVARVRGDVNVEPSEKRLEVIDQGCVYWFHTSASPIHFTSTKDHSQDFT